MLLAQLYDPRMVHVASLPPAAELVLVSVGNTRTRMAHATPGGVGPSAVHENRDLPALTAAARALAETCAAAESAALIASVNDPVAEAIVSGLAGTGPRIYRFGPALPVPIVADVLEPDRVGADRLLAALAAHARSLQACVVIDAGTAMTVDYIDQWGVFKGGCIAPGLRMMLAALHDRTAQLPALAPPDAAALTDLLGKSTEQAMHKGCAAALRGMAHLLIDHYAAINNAYPRVIATGGDAALLFESPPGGESGAGAVWEGALIEHIVPDLVLVGMLEAFLRLSGAAPIPEQPAARTDD